MSQLQGFEIKNNTHKVCLLKKSFYRLKKSPRQ